MWFQHSFPVVRAHPVRGAFVKVHPREEDQLETRFFQGTRRAVQGALRAGTFSNFFQTALDAWMKKKLDWRKAHRIYLEKKRTTESAAAVAAKKKDEGAEVGPVETSNGLADKPVVEEAVVNVNAEDVDDSDGQGTPVYAEFKQEG